MKVAYFISVVVFTANMIAGVVIKHLGDASGRRDKAFRLIKQSDLFITIPTIIVILVTGIYVHKGRGLLGVPLSAVISLFFAYSTSIFAFVVSPIRNKLYELSKQHHFDDVRYNRLSRLWMIWGSIELVPLIAVLWLTS